MAIDALSAANAYKSQLKLQQGLEDAAGGSEAPDDSFAKMVKDGLQNVIDTQNSTEAMKLDSLTGGKVDLSELVTAISSAELTLNTVVAIRDKVISAYQDIIRMPI